MRVTMDKAESVSLAMLQSVNDEILALQRQLSNLERIKTELFRKLPPLITKPSRIRHCRICHVQTSEFFDGSPQCAKHLQRELASILESLLHG